MITTTMTKQRRLSVFFLLLYYNILVSYNHIIILVHSQEENQIQNDNNSTTTNDYYDEMMNAYNTIIPNSLQNKFQLLSSNNNNVIRGNYIVVLNETSINNLNISNRRDIIQDIINQNNETNTINITNIYNTIQSVKISILENFIKNNDTTNTNNTTNNNTTNTTLAEQLISIIQKLLQSDIISFIEEDQTVSLPYATKIPTGTSTPGGTYPNTYNSNNNNNDNTAFVINQDNPIWGLDRIDQTSLPLNNLYHSDVSGANVTVYILDTGILSSHIEFDINRATCPYSAIPNQECIDGNGHGTHVAGNVGGTTYGVAKNVSLVGIKVLSNDGIGSISAILDGLNYILQEKINNPTKKLIINMSLGGFPSRTLDRTIEMITKAGILVIVAAGNSNINACFGSPARIPVVMTVGSTTSNDARSSFSNWGPCVDIFAPGSDITSSWYTSNISTNTISGTSMASPFVAGTAALFLSVAVENQTEPSIIYNKVITGGVLDQLSNLPSETVNLLVNTETLFTTTPFSAASLSFHYSVIQYTIIGIITSCLCLVPLF